MPDQIQTFRNLAIVEANVVIRFFLGGLFEWIPHCRSSQENPRLIQRNTLTMSQTNSQANKTLTAATSILIQSPSS